MKNPKVAYLTAMALLLGLPLAGVWLAGHGLHPYLEFPPLTRYVQHAGFSWPVFVLLGAVAAAATALLVWAVRRGQRRAAGRLQPVRLRGSFPWWGWLGLLAGLLTWVLAWSRFAWFAPLQRHTFAPLWLAYILVVNALCRWRSGRCLLTDRPGAFALLFPASAVFWWFFEYLNRFVQNWYYLGVEDFGPAAYVFLATISFSTVLPAVLSTRDLLLTWPTLSEGLQDGFRPPLGWAKPVAVGSLVVAGAGLAFIGVLPSLLYPLLWVSPLLVAWALQVCHGRCGILDRLAAGDWRDLVAGPLAGLACGGFWEMWNVLSLAKWEYAVPFVDRFHVFEMPLLGYAGYLPFGLECLVLGDLVLGGVCLQGGASADKPGPGRAA
jgi:hypothetical protein